jgi:hypothetical protein
MARDVAAKLLAGACLGLWWATRKVDAVGYTWEAVSRIVPAGSVALRVFARILFSMTVPFACGGSVTGDSRGGGGSGGAGAASGAPVDPCATPAQSACEGDVLLTCSRGTVSRLDCEHGDVPQRICTWLSGRVSAFGCAARIGDACSLIYQGNAVSVDCAGDESGCVEHRDGTSRCVEHLGVCPPGPPSGHEHCAGNYLLNPCQNQPFGYDCADYGSTARCAESGDQGWCEGIPLGGPCDADWNGPTMFPADSLLIEARCAPGSTCIGASMDPGGTMNFGMCVTQ